MTCAFALLLLTAAPAPLSFSTTGHEKAAGVRLTVRLPPGWRMRESNRPTIVQDFIAPKEGGITVMAMLTVQPMPAHFDEVGVRKQLIASKPASKLPPGATLTASAEITVAGMPALLLEYSKTDPAPPPIDSRIVEVQLIVHRALVVLSMSVSSKSLTATELDGRAKEHRLTFLQLVNSIAIDSAP